MTDLSTTPWDLWVLRILDPTAQPADLLALREAHRRQEGWELAACDRLLAGDDSPVRQGRELLAERPELAQGLILTMHLGPYQFVLEPFVAAGLELTILLNRSAEQRLRPIAEGLLRRLGHRGRLSWIAVEDADAGRRLLRTLRDGGPVLAFADGNQGRDGLAGTRRLGVPYRLPGREIRVRTGLARLICRTGCPVHPLCVRWHDDGRGVDWSAQPTQRWGRSDNPVAVTHRLLDWVFTEVAAAPHQWSYWDMLGETAAAFSPPLRSHSITPGLRDDYRRSFMICLARAPDTVRLALDSEVEAWPGDVLADLGNDRFYSAEGLDHGDLDLLRGEGATLTQLMAARNREWLVFHGLRLCLLGLARLSGGVAHA